MMRDMKKDTKKWLIAPPISPTATTSHAEKVLRTDGLEARNRLLESALSLFAEKGFAKTSTREIAQLAKVNISAISYYFGDKANLYRTVFNDPRVNPSIEPEFFAQEELGLEDAITFLVHTFTDTLKQGDLAQSCLKLHLREMLEPTGLWMEEIDSMIKPTHLAMVQFLCRQLNVIKPDDDMHRLAFALSGLALTMMVNGDVIQCVRPSLIAKEKAIDLYAQRLVEYGLAMCENERQRRLQIQVHRPVSGEIKK